MKSDQQLRQERDAHRRAARILSRQLNKRKKIARGVPEKRPHSYFRKDHEYLEGQHAYTLRRIEIFRNAGGEAAWFDESDTWTVEEIRPAMCQGCAETHPVGWMDGEWHHNVKSKGGRRCDCARCGLYVCRSWHLRYHSRVIAVRQVQQ